MIVAEALTRRYGDFTAVEDVSFAIGAGEVVGLLGHNGAGKTTIMKMLTGYLEPSAGRVVIDGAPILDDREAAQATIGYLPENCPIYPEMTVVDFLDFAAEMRRTPLARRDAAVARAIAATDLQEKAASPIGALSRGLRQRVGVAQAILHEPKIVILDEPTNGLDPSQIQAMRALIRTLSETATVILSTHILQEVQAVCDRVILINRGKLALDERRDALTGGAGAVRLTTTLGDAAVRAALTPDALALADLSLAVVSSASAERTTLILSSNAAPLDALAARAAKAVIAAGGDLLSLEPQKRDLEAVFAALSSGAAAAPGSEAEAA